MAELELESRCSITGQVQRGEAVNGFALPPRPAEGGGGSNTSLFILKALFLLSLLLKKANKRKGKMPSQPMEHRLGTWIPAPFLDPVTEPALAWGQGFLGPSC